MLFIDYTILILKDFEEKKSANLLSPLLVNPTTAQIKKECLHVYAARMNKGDKVEESTLMAFFGVPSEGKNFSYVIDKTHPDKFRPIQSFMKGKIKNPSSENVELLAWLIDFNPRPFGRVKDREILVEEILNKEPKAIERSGTSSNIKEEVEVTTTVKEERIELPISNNLYQKKKNKLRWVAVVLLMLAILFGSLYFTSKKEIKYGNIYSGECMTWENDHYKKVACSTKRERNRIVLPFDEKMTLTFKKITREDTITASSIGHIYYIKRQGELEFFTCAGYHPIEVNRPLKVMSQHIYKTYLAQKNTALEGISIK
jgi:hypothetical protein